MQAMIEKYIQLRDTKAAMKAAYTLATEGIDKDLDTLEAQLLAKLNSLGMDSAKCASGTVFKSHRTSAQVADWDFVLKFVQDNGLWNMLEKRVSKAAVEQYKDEHGDIPPGISWRDEITVNIRRS